MQTTITAEKAKDLIFKIKVAREILRDNRDRLKELADELIADHMKGRSRFWLWWHGKSVEDVLKNFAKHSWDNDVDYVIQKLHDPAVADYEWTIQRIYRMHHILEDLEACMDIGDPILLEAKDAKVLSECLKMLEES